MSRKLIQSAIDDAGSQTALGKALGCSQHAVWKALQEGRVSPVMARRMDEWSYGKYSRYDLRPDVFGEHPRSDA